MTHIHDHHGHGHSHGADLGGWEEPMGVGVRRALTTAVVVLALATLAGLALWWPRGDARVDRSAVDFGNREDATVTAAETGPCSYDPTEDCRVVEFEVTSGSGDGDTGSIEVSAATDTPATHLQEGDDFVVTDAGAGAGEGRFQFADVQRSSGLLILVVVFAGAVVALGRRRGLLALAGIAVTMGVLLAYVFPALLRGTSPVGVALTGAGVIAFGTFYLAHGINRRTTVALLGTLAALLLTAALAAGFAGLTELSGLASEDSLTLLAFAPELDFRGLLLAAVVIGALGVLDDVTITQVSAVAELRRSNPSMGGRELYAAGVRIGRDHIASTVNTLVLAYTAAALPLLLLFTQSGLSLGEVLTHETVAVEVVQTLVGSIGLIASVPLTTALACWVVTRSADEEPEPVAPRARRPGRGSGGLGLGLGVDRPDRPTTRRHEAVVPSLDPPQPPPPAQWPAPRADPTQSAPWPSAQDPAPSNGWTSEDPRTSGPWPASQDPDPSNEWSPGDRQASGPWPAQPPSAPSPPPAGWGPEQPARPRTGQVPRVRRPPATWEPEQRGQPAPAPRPGLSARRPDRRPRRPPDEVPPDEPW